MVIINKQCSLLDLALTFLTRAMSCSCCANPKKSGDCPARLQRPLTLLFILLALGSQVVQATEIDSSAEIVLGMSTVLKGAAANLGRDMQKGILVGLERENRVGGVNGRKLRLIALDDGYEPTTPRKQTR